MARIKLEVAGLDGIMKRLNNANADVKHAVNRALTETHRIVTEKADKVAKKHHVSGDTEESLRRNAVIEWQGDVASVKVGFDIAHGGLASIFLMYGTPRMKKDQQLYNAFFGKSTQQEIVRAQEEILYNAIREAESK